MRQRARPAAGNAARITAVLALAGMLDAASPAAAVDPAVIVGPAEVSRPAAVDPPTTPPAPLDSELLRAYLPKSDLGADRFLREHPSADGRGIVVAILDTGIDLNHPGLRETPEGHRKILDVFDATDNGLIDLPFEVTTTGGSLTGLTGRELRLGTVRDDGGRYRMARISAREVFPRGLFGRLLEERREARRRAVDSWEASVARAEAGVSRGAEEDSSADWKDRTRAYRKVRREADRAFVDPGPAYDVVAYRTAGGWRVCIDTDEDGSLDDETPLRPFGLGGELALFPPPASMSVALASIEEDGARCSLFFDEGGHGTHVAGIVGAWYGTDDPLNGLAPGVRFLAVRIGNAKTGGSTSHNSILKGIAWAVEHGATLANLSFGGSSHFQDGREITSRYLDEVVQNRGLFVTVSAGNEGPGLSTVGSPGTARRIFTLGAAISPLTMMASYGGLPSKELPSGIRLFNFSSRGPLANGSPGVDFITPGAAVSTLPTWHLTRNENWNGTSMAAPQACGCLALLLSAAQQDGVPVSPPRVDRAMRATAQALPEVSFVEQGAGLISLPEAYEALKSLAESFPVELSKPSDPGLAEWDSTAVPHCGVPATRDPVTFWKLSVENATGAGEGCYERNEQQSEPYWKTWRVTPDLPEKGANPLRGRFQRVVRLTSEVPWLLAPPQVAIPASGVSIRVLVDPAKLQPGLNTGRVRGRTVATADASGALEPVASAPGDEFDLTAVIVRPEVVTAPDWRWRRVLALAPGDREGVFLRAPEGATRLALHLRETAAEPANHYSVAVTALDLSRPPSALIDGRGVDLARDEEITLYERVQGGTTVELAVFARWVNPGAGALEVTAEFAGVEGPAGHGSPAAFWGEKSPEARWGEEPLVLLPGEDGLRLPLRSQLRAEDVRVAASLDARCEPLEIRWTLQPDTLHPQRLEGGAEPMLLLGRAWLRLDRDESVTVDLHTAPELEDFLDDAFCRVFTPTGALVGSSTLSSGPFPLAAPPDGPPSGSYRLEFSVFAVGRDLVKDARFVSPEVLRGESRGRVTPFPDAVSGRAAGEDSSWSFRLPAGSSRSLFLRVTGLPEGALWSGSLALRDADDRPPLLRVPLRADTRSMSPSAEQSIESSVRALEREAKRLLSLPPAEASAASVSAAIADLDRADALQKAWKGDSFEGSGEWWARLFLRVDLHLRHALGAAVTRGRDAGGGAKDRAAAGASEALGKDARRVAAARHEDAIREVGRLLGEADRHLRGEQGEPDARRLAGRTHLRRTALELAGDDARAARQAYEEARDFDFGGESADPVLSEILLREKKLLEALEPLRRARAADPWNPLLARREIDVFLDLGWVDLADEGIASWIDRFPGEREALREITARRTAATAAAESRSILAASPK
jgi:subtilisin family serine protease